MTDQTTASTMRAVRFHEYGKPAEVLHLEDAPIPEPRAGTIRIAVHSCGLAPADWALCGGLFAGDLPRGVGIDVSGTVDAIGDGVTDVTVGDPVVGNADWRTSSSAGASDFTIMNRWTPVPTGLDLAEAAALPMAVDTAYLHLTLLGLEPGKTILINGAGTTIGFAAVQIALVRGMRVVATAGQTHAQQLRDFGADVTTYGAGLLDRVRAITGQPIDLALDAAPVGGALPELIELAGGRPQNVLSSGGSIPEAAELGARDSFHEVRPEGLDALPEFAQLAADGRFSIPIAGVFPLGDWRTALEISEGGQARGKLLLRVGGAGATDATGATD